jgi:hypothetical protein
MVVDVVCGACGSRVLPPTGIAGDDGGDGFGLHKVVDAVGIQPAVVDDGPHGDRQGMRRTGLQEAVQTGRPHGEVGDVGGSQPDMDRQGMVWGDDTVLEVAMAEKVGVAVGIIPPRGGRIPIEPVMLTAEDALGATVTGGAAVWACARGEGRAIAAQDKGLEIPQESALPRGEDPTAEEQVFETGEEVLGTGLVSGREQFLGQSLRDGVGLGGIAGLGGMPLGLFLLQVAPMTPLALAARTGVMGTRRSIYGPSSRRSIKV